MPSSANDIIRQLQKDILPLQGFKAAAGNSISIGLKPVEDAFPNAVFPTGAVHEFLTASKEDAAATAGFMAGVLSNLTSSGGTCVWVGMCRNIFPPALKIFGINPERVIFAELKKEKEVLWVMEEALKCKGLAAVIGEIKDIDFKTSRRLQLAVEQSRVTGFIVRNNPRQLNTIACVARWKITPLASENAVPGVGFARWNVALQKVRNGKPGNWEVEWNDGSFHIIEHEKETIWLNASSQYGSAI